jgi:hypothetical protein
LIRPLPQKAVMIIIGNTKKNIQGAKKQVDRYRVDPI